MSPMFYAHIILYFLFARSIVQAVHFRGGYLSWQIVSPNKTNATMITINIQQTYSWTYARYNCTSVIGDAGYLNCIPSNCGNYSNNVVKIAGPCISYDSGLDVSTGQSITPVILPVGSQVILMYSSNAWLPLVQSTSLVYNLITFIDLTVRTDNGLINSSPTSTMTALVTVLVNVQQVLRIPMADIDFDIVKCRWANKTSLIRNTLVDECQGVCQNIPGAQLFTSANTDNNCSLIFTAVSAGYYVVALQIEDFMPSAPNGSPLSSIPLQFLVRTLNISCDQPSIIGQLADSTTVQVEANSTFSISIIAQAGCNTSSVNRFLTITVPLGTSNTTPVTSLGSLLYSIVFIWTPTNDQIGTTQLFCTVAIDTNNLQSPQYCLNFVVISTTASTVTTASTSNIPTTSITTTSSVDNRPANLGLILGLGIPLLLFSSILASCVACRWHPGQFWRKLRQRFWEEKNTSCQQCQNSSVQDSSMNNRQVANEIPKQYRQQYINAKSVTPTSQSSYINSFFPDSTSSSDRASMSTTRTSLLSSYSNRTLPDVETPTSIMNSLQTLHPMQGGSILVQTYVQQIGQNNYRF